MMGCQGGVGHLAHGGVGWAPPGLEELEREGHALLLLLAGAPRPNPDVQLTRRVQDEYIRRLEERPHERLGLNLRGDHGPALVTEPVEPRLGVHSAGDLLVIPPRRCALKREKVF
jgi:hypothetical protein